jgi:hypothetical protein
MAGRRSQRPGRRPAVPQQSARDRWSERRNWVYGLISAALAGLIVVVIQSVLGLGDDDPAPAASSSTATDRALTSSGAPTDVAEAKVEAEPTITASVTYPKDTCSTFVVPDSLDVYGPAPESSELAQWARQRDAATAGPAMIMVTVTGHDERPVTITDLTFSTTVQEDAPATGTTVANECGDQTIARYARVDLDQSPPQIVDSSSTEISVGDMSTSPLAFPYEVTSTENENLLLIAETQGYVEWTASLTWSNGVDSGVLTIDDDGEPFRTALPAAENPYAIPAGFGEWLTD